MTTTSTLCPVCGGVNSTSDGGREQRYICEDCGYRSRRANQVVASRMRKKEYFAKYLHDFSDGLVTSLCGMSRLYNISEKTALQWRRKALSLVGERLDIESCLAGRVEADEVFVPKGAPGQKGGIRGRPRKRGSRRLVGTSKRDQVPVASLIERGTGRIILRTTPGCTTEDLSLALKGNLARGSRLITDGWRSYITVARKQGLRHTRVLVKDQRLAGDWKHINTVNSLHSRLKIFLMAFRGLYHRTLEHYLAWFHCREDATVQSWLANLSIQLGWSPCVTCGK